MRIARLFALVAALALLAGASTRCSPSTNSGEEPKKKMTRAELLDPNTCKPCHEDHFREWSGSMHAYAAEDPVFLAMNKRGQRETNGALGAFCVGCHAPMAVRENATKDGLNLGEVPAKLRGVTCFFCHSTEAVDGTHNNPLRLAAASDLRMRGEVKDPLPNSAHDATYSLLHDRDRAESSQLCGACHDIVTNHGAHIERTFLEWQQSVFSQSGGATCSQCHMDQSATPKPIAGVPRAVPRRPKSHAFAAVDVALTPFPEQDLQRQKVKELLDTTLQTGLCVSVQGAAPPSIRVLVDNVAAGHAFPSGSSQDRRLWAEVIAYNGSDIIYQSGVVPSGGVVTKIVDPDLWLLRDCIFDAQGKETHMFWEASSFESNGLPGQATFDRLDPRFYQHFVQRFPRQAGANLAANPDRVTLRIRLQPIGLDVLDELIASGDLAASFRNAMPTFDVGSPDAVLEWTEATATTKYIDNEDRAELRCITKTSLNVVADKLPAPRRVKCAP